MMILRYHTTVADLSERFEQVWEERCLVPGPSLGWWIRFEGSFEAICVGNSRPDFEIGDKVEIVVKKVELPPQPAQ